MNGKPGRPTKLNKATFKAIVDAIASNGVSREVAAACASVGVGTLYNWLRWGREAKEGLYHEFFVAVKKAEAEAEHLAVKTIRTASRRQWQAAAWWLERKFPDRWGKKDRQEHSGTIVQRHSGTINVRHVIEEFEAKYGSDLEAIARTRLGVAVPCLLGSDGAAESVPGSAARSLHGPNGNGSHSGQNGNGHPRD